MRSGSLCRNQLKYGIVFQSMCMSLWIIKYSVGNSLLDHIERWILMWQLGFWWSAFSFVWHIPRDGFLIIMIMMVVGQITDIDEDKRRVKHGGDTSTESLLKRWWWLNRHMKTFKFLFFFTAFNKVIIDNVMQYVLYAGDKQ